MNAKPERADQGATSGPSTIDEYIAGFAPDIRAILEEIRATVHAAAPWASERISYGMPAFYQNGILVYFAAFKKHIGFYPTPSGIEAFKDELAQFESAKGSVRFPLELPIPFGLIAKIAAFRAAENGQDEKNK